MPGSIRIGRIAGIDIYINISWILILVFLTISLASGWFPQFYPGQTTSIYLILGFIATILLFLSVLLHELGHSLVARSRGLPVKSITLFIFGGVSNIEHEPPSAGIEFQMAFVGPVISLLIGILSGLIWLLVRSGSSLVGAIAAYLALTNILLGVFNLLPGFPLDGGRVLRSIIWKFTGSQVKATNITTIAGQIIAYLFILIGVFLFFTGSPFNGIWIGFIGWFLLSSAQSARLQSSIDTAFHGVTVEQVMNRIVITVPANISLRRLVDEYFLPQGLRSALVLQGDYFAGIVTLSDIRTIPREQWGQTPVGQIMVPRSNLHVVSPTQSMREALTVMNSGNINQLPVVDNNDQLVGVLTREAVLRSLEIRRHLGMTHETSLST